MMSKTVYQPFLNVFLILSLIPNVIAIAQQNVQLQTLDRAAQYQLGSENDLLIPINIWGFVEKPGQYLVPMNTDLISLLSFAGGPREGAKITNIRIVSSDPSLMNKIQEINVKKFLETGDPKLIPILRPRDTIVVKGTTFNWFREFISFISSLSFIGTFAYYMTRAID
ncbi:hypothetical protein JW824_00970 [bacterium]|nr:hypothetical protein [bacterium]RQV98665.1 MAG: hypothetical protein EH221_01495 [bacterium]